MHLFIAAVEPSGIYLGLLFAELVVNVAMGIGLYWVGAKTSKIDNLEKRLGEQSEKTITAMFDNYTSSLRLSMNQVSQQIQQFNDRLDEGDGDLRGLAERDHSVELTMEKKFGELRQFMGSTFVTREDLQHHQDSVSEQMNRMSRDSIELGKAVAVFASILERERRFGA